MALNNTQELIERSIFTAIRQVLVSEGLWPAWDINTYPNTEQGINAWKTAIDAVVAAKGFAAQPFGFGSPNSRDIKHLPRITIITRRFDPGDIGNPVDPQVIQNPANLDTYKEIIRPQESMHLQTEVHVITKEAKQERLLNAVVYQALGSKSFIPWYNQTGTFFLRQFNSYDLPDPPEGILEKVHCYEARDIYIQNDTIINSNVPLINEITLDVLISEGILSPGIPSPPTVIDDGSIVIDLSHIQYID